MTQSRSARLNSYGHVVPIAIFTVAFCLTQLQVPKQLYSTNYR